MFLNKMTGFHKTVLPFFNITLDTKNVIEGRVTPREAHAHNLTVALGSSLMSRHALERVQSLLTCG